MRWKQMVFFLICDIIFRLYKTAEVMELCIDEKEKIRA